MYKIIVKHRDPQSATYLYMVERGVVIRNHSHLRLELPADASGQPQVERVARAHLGLGGR
jgi:hypothetical protein